jgi:hypothetical protein
MAWVRPQKPAKKRQESGYGALRSGSVVEHATQKAVRRDPGALAGKSPILHWGQGFSCPVGGWNGFGPPSVQSADSTQGGKVQWDLK